MSKPQTRKPLNWMCAKCECMFDEDDDILVSEDGGRTHVTICPNCGERGNMIDGPDA